MNRTCLAIEKHKRFIREQKAAKQENELEYWMSEHLRLSGIYWSLTGYYLVLNPASFAEYHKLINASNTVFPLTKDSEELSRENSKESVIRYILQCQNEDGGFGGALGYDSHILYTLSAVQCLLILCSPSDFDTLLPRERQERIIDFVCGLQREDGSFVGDACFDEVDTRFTFCSIATLALLKSLPSQAQHRNNDHDTTSYHNKVNIDKAVEYLVQKCRNFDGGFGSCAGAESHSGQIFCCVGTLAILDRLNYAFPTRESGDELAWWLAERQLSESGGLNGRPEKKEDVCYSWWVLSSLCILGRQSWIDGRALSNFILNSQDIADNDNDSECGIGGIADREGDMPDIFHTLFGLAGLSLLGYEEGDKGKRLLAEIDPVFCMPTQVLNSHGIRSFSA